MICDLEDIRNDSIINAAKVFKGSATAIKQEGNMMRIPFGDYQAIKTKAAATFLAERQAVKVQEWAEKKFKKVYSFGWTEIDKTMSDVIKVSIKFPKSLYESYKVKKGMQTMAEMELALMGEDYFKQQDEVSNVVDEVEQSEVKEGVNFVFEQNPELSEIGTQQLYSEYLDSIFPDSKVKDIVYRGDGSILNKAINSTFGTGYYFTPKKSYAENFAEIASSKDKGYGLYISLINLKNPLIYNETVKNYKIERSRIGKAKDKYKEYALDKLKNNEDIPYLADLVNNQNTTPLYTYKNGVYFTSRGREVSVEEVKQNIDLQVSKSIDDNVSVTTEKSDLENINEQLTENNDGIVINIQEKYKHINNEYVVFEPEQIHILGGKQDVERFREFVGKTTQKDNKVELESNLKELNKVDNQEGVENLRESMLRDFNSYYPQYSDLAQWEKETMIDMMMEGELITYC